MLVGNKLVNVIGRVKCDKKAQACRDCVCLELDEREGGVRMGRSTVSETVNEVDQT